MDMTIFFILLSIIQSFSISLGVGSSTLAILNFFVAISDGTIEPTERRMMGITYLVLRIAMVAILLSTAVLIALVYPLNEFSSLPGYIYAQLTILCVLFTNAVLMTAHLMPSTFGPAIQAGSWYTLGTIAALLLLGLDSFSYWHFVLGYVTWVVLVISIVNGVMATLRQRRK